MFCVYVCIYAARHFRHVHHLAPQILSTSSPPLSPLTNVSATDALVPCHLTLPQPPLSPSLPLFPRPRLARVPRPHPPRLGLKVHDVLFSLTEGDLTD